MSLDSDYWRALDYVRRSTPLNAIVLDGMTAIRDVNVTLMLGERRVYLPSPYDLYVGQDGVRRPEIQKRVQDWKRWEATNLKDEEFSRQFASKSDYLIARTVHRRSWIGDRFFREGSCAVYKSQRRVAASE